MRIVTAAAQKELLGPGMVVCDLAYRGDGTPTYNFCVVVDDVTMKITHVIRGNDHLNNTPKQIACYAALGYATPFVAPMREGIVVGLQAHEVDHAFKVVLAANGKNYSEGYTLVTREDLQSNIQELEGSNEELKAANEEIESSNEELQSTNEELNTVNDELQNRNQELNQSTNDTINLLVAVGSALVISEATRIVSFTGSTATGRTIAEAIAGAARSRAARVRGPSTRRGPSPCSRTRTARRARAGAATP